MPNTVEYVRKIIERDGSIKRDLGRGLINVRALARHIQKRFREETGGELSADAIISAIRRRHVLEEGADYKEIGSLMKKLTMKNKIVDVSMTNDPEIPSALGQIASQINLSRGETFRIVAGVESVRIIMDEKNLDKLKLVPKQRILKTNSGLAEIIVSLPETAERTPGVVSTITTELAMNGINMIEFMSCVPELILVVEEKDALRSYELLDSLASGKV